jgi:hypothetical protein
MIFSGGNSIVTLGYASGAYDHASVIGVTSGATASGDPITLETLAGRELFVQMDVALTGLTAGKPVFLSPITRGAGTTAAPATSGTIAKTLGYISDASPYISGAIASSRLKIIFQPGQQIQLG